MLSNLNEVNAKVQEREIERAERFSTYFQSSEFGNTGIFIIIAELM